jgi:uncharacterized protein YjiS (DUF1127 family)
MSCASISCSSIISINLSPAPRFARPDAVTRPWREALLSMLAYVSRCHARHNQRRALIELDDHMLADIGLSRDEALREARKLFWQ